MHVPLSTLPVSRSSLVLGVRHGIYAHPNTLLTLRNAGLNVLVIFIPLAWVSHFHEWTHGLTFARMS